MPFQKFGAPEFSTIEIVERPLFDASGSLTFSQTEIADALKKASADAEKPAAQTAEIPAPITPSK